MTPLWAEVTVEWVEVMVVWVEVMVEWVEVMVEWVEVMVEWVEVMVVWVGGTVALKAIMEEAIMEKAIMKEAIMEKAIMEEDVMDITVVMDITAAATVGAGIPGGPSYIATMSLAITSAGLDTTYKLPLQIRTNLLPNLILYVELVAVFQQRKGGQIFIQLQKFTKLIQDIRIR